jgi:hypothetical protein
VPAGSKVNIDHATDFNSLNFLNIEFELGQLGNTKILSRINNDPNITCEENTTSGDERECFDFNDLFQELDFENNDNNEGLIGEVTSMSVLGLIFDQDLSYYYFDEAVKADGTWYPDPNNNSGLDSHMVLVDGFTWYSGGDQTAQVCASGTHQVEMSHWSSTNELRYCNPGDSNYYVEISSSEFYLFPFAPQPESYEALQNGTPCSGLECLQQCEVISQIGAEGERDLSWVRTDIWWRSSQNATFNRGWQAYYYDSASYARDSVYFESTNTSTPNINKYFGSAHGSSLGYPVVTQAPLSTQENPNEAAIFFGQNLNTARAQMRYLFARWYNLTWEWW